MTTGKYGGAEVSLRVVRDGGTSSARLSNLRSVAADIVDCHVIYESLDYAKGFTGERYYPCSKRIARLVVKSVEDCA
jgi:hypothetical protein